ncbi:hypothetical protein PACTADRAFT_3796 [Pachysolen tannophilus NRRL Y-2460]|uniref:Inner membrane assembly complex subunit 17 n=1 Tax=Pachysolen tannophilus NRRL Y-2460 TaxID=669874 RepID=A0A1E4TT33_PACTA|nr:hypothetical protein PACTADRAFT_3796 [Pachysolen tannophilus NRRL Y-2460]
MIGRNLIRYSVLSTVNKSTPYGMIFINRLSSTSIAYQQQHHHKEKSLPTSREDQLLDSIPSKSKEIQSRIDVLNQKTKFLKQASVLESQDLNSLKPRISDFKLPILNFFITSMTIYLALQWIWLYLEKEEQARTYRECVIKLENEIQEILDEKDEKQNKWFGWLWKH